MYCGVNTDSNFLPEKDWSQTSFLLNDLLLHFDEFMQTVHFLERSHSYVYTTSLLTLVL